MYTRAPIVQSTVPDPPDRIYMGLPPPGAACCRVLPITECGAGSARFQYVNGTVRRKPAAGSPAGAPDLCLDAIHGFKFTDVGEYGCHGAGSPDALSQQFRYAPEARLLINAATGQCVVPSRHAPKRACSGVAFAGRAQDGPGYVSCALSVDRSRPPWGG